MAVTTHFYNYDSDYERVSQFLVRMYRTSGKHINWLQPRWEYMHYHPLIEKVDLSSTGVWEAEGEILAVAHLEHSEGTAYFEIDPSCPALEGEMLTYAEKHLCTAKDGGKALWIFINDSDDEFGDMVAAMGYQKQEMDLKTHAGFEVMSRFVISERFPAISVPEGFRLKSLAEDNDLGHPTVW